MKSKAMIRIESAATIYNTVSLKLKTKQTKAKTVLICSFLERSSRANGHANTETYLNLIITFLFTISTV